ncbi:hypothetical protein [uncultured Sulfitobacter sp.]|uniref:hypothetical protein n=1 Tax=uncultured Sulfitobacter sp. TaxID=191468 RepID=UPI00260F99B4|nr:hypothetical protein [uncultured Sulfitobacter sp.]
MPRFIIHAGFHKTGTTSLQHTLRANRAALRPDVRIVLRGGMIPLCEAARAYSISRSEVDLGMVKYEAAELAQKLESDSAEQFIISSEDLSGHMPWRHGLRDYSAAPKVMKAIAVAFEMVHPDAEQIYFFSTRAAEPWLRSCYAQHLRARRMTMEEDEYLTRFKRSADLATIVERVREELPKHKVLATALEEMSATPLGPLNAVLDILDVPSVRRATFVTPPPSALNETPTQAIKDTLLRLNRSKLDDETVRQARRDLMAANR